MTNQPIVSIVMGSDSDLEIMREAGKALDEFGIAYEIDVTSAHRSPDRTADFARKAAERGIRVIIAGAGGAAHLAGVIAAHTTLPVIGVPIPSTSLNGLDSLLATVQMPAGIPVATVAIGKPGAKVIDKGHRVFAITSADQPRDYQLGIGVNRGPRPCVAGAGGSGLRRGHVLLFAMRECPNFVYLASARLHVAHMRIMVGHARLAGGD